MMNSKVILNKIRAHVYALQSEDLSKPTFKIKQKVGAVRKLLNELKHPDLVQYVSEADAMVEPIKSLL